METQKIYEAVDVTDEEAYYTIGVFPSLKDALGAIRATENPWRLCENAMFHGEAATIEIREREVGLKPNDLGKVVWKTEWTNEYNEEVDDNEWVVKFETPYACPHCGSPKGTWFDRSFSVDNEGNEIEPMGNRCEDCGLIVD